MKAKAGTASVFILMGVIPTQTAVKLLQGYKEAAEQMAYLL